MLLKELKQIAQANTALRIDRESKGKPKQYGLSQEQIDAIHAESDALTQIIKEALVTTAKKNIESMPDIFSIKEENIGKPYDAVSLLKCIAQYGTEQQKALAKAFIPIFEKTDIKCVFLHKGDDGTAGTTHHTRQDNTYDISFNMDAVKMARNPYQTMLHELVHSLTVNRLRNDETLRNGTIELMEYVRNFLRERGVPESATYNKRGEDYTIALDTYGVHNEREFMAEALANPKFQALLKQIPAPKEPLTAWQKVCSLIAQAFRRLFNIQYKQDTNVFDLLVPVVADTMTVTAQQGERGREKLDALWNLERNATMQAMAAEVVSALNVSIDDLGGKALVRGNAFYIPEAAYYYYKINAIFSELRDGAGLYKTLKNDKYKQLEKMQMSLKDISNVEEAQQIYNNIVNSVTNDFGDSAKKLVTRFLETNRSWKWNTEVENALKKEIENAFGQAPSSTINDIHVLLKQKVTDQATSTLIDLVFGALDGSDIKVVAKDLGEGVSGRFVASENTIYYNPNAIQVNTLLHEATHAATSYYLQGTDIKAFPREVQIAIKEIEECHRLLVEDWKKTHNYGDTAMNKSFMRMDFEQNDTYGYTSAEEMVAELSKPEFLEHIKDFDRRHKGESLFSKLVDAIARLFGIDKQYTSLEKTVKDALVTILTNPSVELMQRYSKENATIKENVQKFKDSKPVIIMHRHGINAMMQSIPESDEGMPWIDTTLTIPADMADSLVYADDDKYQDAKRWKKGTILKYNENDSLRFVLNGQVNREGEDLIFPVRIYGWTGLSNYSLDIKIGENGLSYVDSVTPVFEEMKPSAQSSPSTGGNKSVLTTKQALDRANGFIGEVNKSPYVKKGDRFVLKSGTPVLDALKVVMDRGHRPDKSVYGDVYDGQVSYNLGYESGTKAVMAVTNRDLFDEGWQATDILLMREPERLGQPLENHIKTDIESNKQATFLVNENDKVLIDYLEKKRYKYELYTDTPVVAPSTPDTTNINPANYHLVSGAADGSDTIWAEEARKLGMQVTDITTEDWDKLDSETKARYEKYFRDICHQIGRPVSDSKYPRRDLLQADRSDAVFAIGMLQSGSSIVDGGTGYATTRAVNTGKPVYLFEQNRGQWLQFNYQTRTWQPTGVPKLTPNAAVIGTRRINDSGKAAIIGVLNNTLGIEVSSGNTATQKPQGNIRKIKPFSLEPIEGQEKQYKLRKNKDITDATADEIKYSIEEMFETGEIPFGIDIIGEQLTEDEIKALDSAACLNKVDISREKAELNRNDIGRWTVGRTAAEIALKQQEDTLLNSTLFGNRELRQLSMLTMFKLSEQISKLQSGEESGEDILGPDFKDIDFTKMSRIDILNKIGLSRLFNEVIKERIFNFKLNPSLKKNRTLMKKATLIKDNFDAFIRMGYDNLIEREHVAPTGVINGIKSDTDSAIQNEDGEDLSEEEIQEIFGSSVEAWQTGFRQMSTFTNLTKLIRERLDRLYELDDEGNKVVNEWGIEKNIDSHEAVTKILKWTQGATDIFDMINKLKERQQSNPWVSQLIDILNDDNEEQFRSQFYSNFKKYFQPYHVIYKKKNKNGFEQTVIIMVNKDSFIKNTLDTLSSLDNSGKLTIYDGNTHKFNQQALGILAGARDAIAADLGNMTDAGVESVMNAFKALNIPVPAKEDMARILEDTDKAIAIKNALSYIYKELNANSKKALDDDYRVLHAKNNSKGLKDTKSDYESLARAIADAMSDGLESVSYEAGKLHYSFVTPSYLSSWVESMKGKKGDFEEFVKKQYGNVVGWFYNPEQHENQQGPEGWLNYWLAEMMDDTVEADRLRKIFDHTVVLSDNGVAYADKSPAQYLASLMQMYLYDNEGRTAWFRMPMMSNKQSEEYLRFARIHYNGYTDGYKDVILDWLCEKTVYQEINRIRAVNARKALPDVNKIANFDKNGTRFHFLPMLNKYLSDDSTLGKLLRKKIAGEKFDETQNETNKFRTLVRDAIKEGINAKYDLFKRTLNEEGIIELKEGNSDEIEKVNILQDKLDAANANRVLEEFFWNDMFASINIMQLTIIDPAQYKDTEDLQKRLAQLHSPGMRGNVNATINGRPVTDKFTRTIYIADDVVRSEIIPCLEVIKSRVLSQERYQKNAAAKAMMTKQFDFIIDTFANTNVTDAQAYTSPTGYRKKMAVFGKWTPRDEELYQKIMSGEFNELDLANVWQPLKPFVYSTIEKDGHNDFMPVIKIGVQNKNSEYCLIMADALMRSQGMETKLTALFDFMEASHGLTKGVDGKWTGTPNTDGIDTIQFDSTVKVGKTGVMDINDKKIKDGANKGTPVQPYTYKEIMDMFNSLAGKVNGDYNDMWVHKIPFDDYAIQQETPTHFLEHEQQQGSQDRILIWADMPDVDSNGKANMITVNLKPMTVAEAKKQYFEAIARNIERSKQEVIEKFGLQNRSRKLRNVFLSRILQEEILKDSRYGTDLYWACGLNESGEFNIPLSDPIQSDRIQQLLNSIIKNHVNKQMVAGGPVVQVSCYGYSEDLSIRFKDKNGNLLKSFKEYKKAMTKNWESDGHTEPLPEEQVINQYKEYLRVNYASVAYYECYAPIYDENLLRDFADENGVIDIKKVEKANPKLLEMVGYRIPTEAKYSMTPLKIVGFMPKSAGEGIMLPKEITALSGSDFDIDKLYIMRYQLDRNDNSREVINSIIEEERLTQKMSGAKFNAREFRQRVNDIVSGTVTPESHEQWILDTWNNKHELTYTEPTEGRNADNNTIVATQWAVLTSALAEDQVLSCGNFEELKRVGYMIAALDNGSKYDSLTGLDAGALKKLAYKDTYLQFADTQMQFHKQNMVAAKLIGVFAQSNVSHAFMNTLGGLQLVFPDKFAFKLDGHTISENLDGEYGYDGTRISSILAQLLAASVDAVKDPVMSKLNISMDTVNAATTLARMGYDLEFIGWFLTHPAIKRLVTRYNNSVAAGNKTSMIKVLHEMQTELVDAGTDIKLDTQKDFNKKFFIEDHFRQITTDPEELNNQKVNDWMVLEMYRRLNNISEALRDVLLMTRFNSITSAVGPFASDTMDNKIKVNGFESNKWISDESKKAIQTQPILNAFRQSSMQLEEALLGQNIIQASGVAYAAYKTLHDMMGYMSKKMAREFSKFFISYYVNKGDNPVFDLSDEHRAEVLDKFPKEFMSIKADYSDNFLVKNIMMETDQLGRDVLRLYTRGMSDTQLQNLRSAWADLYEDNKFNAFADKDNLAVRLAEYCFFTGSFGFSPKTFISLTPNVVRQALPNYINNCCNYNGMSNGDIIRLVLQFMLNMGYANAGTIEEKDFKKIGDTQVEGKSFPNFEGTIGLARVRDANRNIKYYLLERKPDDENFKYTEVSKLGGANQEAFEIDPSRDITQMQSVIKQQSVEKGSKEEDEGKAPERPVVNNSRLFEQIAQKLGTFNPMSGTKSILETQAEFNRILSNSGADQLAEILGLPSTIISKVADKLNMPSDILASNAKKVMDEIDLCV